MKNLNKYFFVTLIIIICLAKQSHSQSSDLDSLYKLLKTAKHDTSWLRLRYQIGETGSIFRIGYWDSLYIDAKKFKTKNFEAAALNNIGFIFDNQGDIPNALSYYNKSLTITEKIGDKKDIASALHNIGSVYKTQGDIHMALYYYGRGLKIWEEIGNKPGLAATLNNIGAIHDNQGNIPLALEYYGRSLKMREEIGDKRGIGSSLHNLGFIYSNQGDLSKAMEYFSRSLKIREENGDKEGIAYSLNSIGLTYYNQGNIPDAINYYLRSLKIREQIGDKKGIGVSLNNIGVVYRNLGEISKALDYFQQSLKIRREISEKEGVTSSLNNIGSTYFKLASNTLVFAQRRKFLLLAYSYSDSSLVLSKQLGFPSKIRVSEMTLSKIDSALGNYKGALEHYTQFIIYRDSISNQETRKASLKNQLKYEFEKKEAVIKEQQEKERAVSEEQNHRQQIVIWSVACGLLLVIVFAGFVFRSLKITRIQKVIIEMKQKDILDSIHYAKRIQKSLLPTEKYIIKNLNKLKKG